MEDEILWKILLVDDDEDDYVLTRQMLAEARHGKIALNWASTYESGLQALLSDGYDAVLMDYDLGARTGIDLIRETMPHVTKTPIILLTGRGSYEVDLEAMQAGATLYLTKNEANPLLLERGIRYAIERKQVEEALQCANDMLAQANRDLKQELAYREMAEQALAASEDRFRSVLENSLDLAYRRNLQTDQYEYLSPVVEQMLGFTSHEMKAWKSDELLNRIHPEDRGVVDQQLAQASETGKGMLEYRFLAKNGQYRWLADNFTILKDEAGRPLYRGGNVRDMTERKQAEETIRRGQAALEQAGEIAHLGAWEIEFVNLVDVNANPLYWSPEVYRIFGYEPGSIEVTNDLFFERVHPDDRSRVVETFANALSEHISYSIEHRIIRPDNEERWVVEHAQIKFNEHGRPLWITGAVQDISERIRLEEQLRQQEAKFAALFDQCPFAMILASLPDTRLVEVNQAWLNLFGYSREEVDGKTGLELGWQRDRDRQERLLSALEAHGMIRGWKTTNHAKDGRPVSVSCNVHVIESVSQKYLLITLEELDGKPQT